MNKPKLSALAAEMAKQASLGHEQFCLGVHTHDNGELEEEWIDWSEAFEKLAVINAYEAGKFDFTPRGEF